MRVFLDTNVLASAVATRGICADILQTVLAEHELVVGQAVLVELSRVLVRRFGITSELVAETEEFLRREGEVIDAAPPFGAAVRDPDDAIILDQAVAGAADVLVTGDRDLLEMDSDPPIRILSPRGFWELLRSEAAE